MAYISMSLIHEIYPIKSSLLHTNIFSSVVRNYLLTAKSDFQEAAKKNIVGAISQI